MRGKCTGKFIAFPRMCQLPATDGTFSTTDYTLPAISAPASASSKISQLGCI
ncbi:hypothetical protein SAMN04487996_113190 [Dyadobacter soli]|uniref:Uncharacterized protein n=1 Tax=Dyadobacter soli TaxID=659014 RepID=A0A1G7Q1T5_9BACT|nr:hypothetical protein SAMN04487996_113190 [Dyadobacter soli]